MTHDASSDPRWYRDAVIYELHVRAFSDSNADGIGDFAGLTSKLDYLQELGVTAIWILPFYPSPLRDDGYDIADYRSVHADYGTIRQFRRFVAEAHARGLKVITELVINHTSDQHEWFRRAVAAPAGSQARDWYVWSDTADGYPEVRVIFQDFETSNWAWHPGAGQYYWHRFYSHQPDLNFDNPEVRDAVKSALDFWAEMGVDGFRLDAIPYLYEREGSNGENLPETHEFLKELRAHLDARWPNRMFLAEANQWPEDAAAYFGDGDECHMNFNFPLMPRLFMAVSQEDRFPIIDIFQQTPDIPDNCQWAVFLRNHDELTLEMVTDEERDFMYRAYARDPRMRVNLGIRRRLAPLLNNNRRLIELMNSLLFALPGAPVIYYGDEIGMGDNVFLGDRNGVRTPMQWSSDRNAGFSSANPQRLYLPVVIDPEYHFETVNVEAQLNNPDSLLWWMRRLIALRRRHDVFSRGGIEFLHPDNAKVLAFTRSDAPDGDGDSPNHAVLVVANLSRHAQACELDLSDHAGYQPVEMFGRTPFPEIGTTPYPLTLGPHQSFWLSLEPAVDPVTLMPRELGAEDEERPTVTVAGEWTALLRGRGRDRFEAVLPEVLRRRRWFGGKARRVRHARVIDIVAVPKADDPLLRLLVVEVEYAAGEPETYLLPVVFAEGEEAGRIEATAPQAVLAEVRGGSRGQSGFLVDALHEPAAAAAILDMIGRRRTARSRSAKLEGARLPGFGRLTEIAELEPHLLRGEQSNTNIIFGNALLMKVVRKLEPGISPDVEIGRYLAERGFPSVPRLVGTLDYVVGDGDRRTAAIVQQLVPNEGDAWTLTVGEVERFGERMLTEAAAARPDAGAGRGVWSLATGALPKSVVATMGRSLDLASLLGNRTGELHLALASAEDAAFAPEAISALDQRSLYQAIRTAVRRNLDTAKRYAANLVEPHRSQIEALTARESEILERVRAMASPRIQSQRIRVHGDYHLGQVLWTGRDYVIIDFEGEPARPLGERRLKRSPLRDVAGMLRSYHYATHQARHELDERGVLGETGATADTIERWLDYWYRWSAAAFLRGYLDVTGDTALVPASEERAGTLLEAFLIEKAVYELAYEMNNRPDWLAIPIAGINGILDHSRS